MNRNLELGYVFLILFVGTLVEYAMGIWGIVLTFTGFFAFFILRIFNNPSSKGKKKEVKS